MKADVLILRSNSTPALVQQSCGCEYCDIDARRGLFHEACPYFIEFWTEQRVDGWYAMVNFHDGEQWKQQGPHKDRPKAVAATEEYAAICLERLGGAYKLERPS